MDSYQSVNKKSALALLLGVAGLGFFAGNQMAKPNAMADAPEAAFLMNEMPSEEDVANMQIQVAVETNIGWVQKDGWAQDIAARNGHLWVTGGGDGIYKWNGWGWDQMPGAAVRIAMGADGRPWVVNSGGSIYEWNGSNWEGRPGWAQDITVGRYGDVYVTGGSDGIFKWNPSNYSWDQMPGAAKKIAAGNTVWVVNAGGSIYEWTNEAWEEVGGWAQDIGACNEYVAVTGGGDGIFKWSRNMGGWFQTTGAAQVIDVDCNDGGNGAVDMSILHVVSGGGNIYSH